MKTAVKPSPAPVTVAEVETINGVWQRNKRQQLGRPSFWLCFRCATGWEHAQFCLPDDGLCEDCGRRAGRHEFHAKRPDQE